MCLAAHGARFGFVYVFQEPTSGRAGGLFGLAFGLYAPRILRVQPPRRPPYRAPSRTSSGTPLIFGRRAAVAVA